MSIVERLQRDNKDFSQEIAHIAQVSSLPRGVERMASSIDANFRTTADALVASAQALEARAANLREKAEYLLNNINLADDLRKFVKYERNCYDEAKSLALVAVPDRHTQD